MLYLFRLPPSAACRRGALAVLAFCCAVLLPLAVGAETFRGYVTHVTDGDTLWIRPAPGADAVQIRLLDLDAPEGCQLFGKQAKQALRERVLNEWVRVRPKGFDDYGRQLARVDYRGEDVGAWLVRNGFAWSMSFQGRQGPYARLETQARQEQKGLWALQGAQDPRSFRKRFGRCQ